MGSPKNCGWIASREPSLIVTRLYEGVIGGNMNRKRLWITLLTSLLLISSIALAGFGPIGEPSLTLLASGLEGSTGMGSTIGPGGMLDRTVFASGECSTSPKARPAGSHASIPRAVKSRFSPAACRRQ